MSTKTMSRQKCDIAAAMRKRYPSNAYALIFEVGDATGMNCSRHADAIAMSLWPSRGLDLIGFEFKASRTDWLKHDNPEKAEAVMQYCDSWYLVVSDESIVHQGELPKSWGLLAIKNNTLKEITKPAELTPKPWTRDFLAAILRRVSEPIAAVDAGALMTAKEQGRREEAERSQRTFKQLEEKYIALNRSVIEFENTSGVKVANRWEGITAHELSNALAALADKSHEKRLSDLRHISRTVESLRVQLEATITGIEKLANQ